MSLNDYNTQNWENLVSRDPAVKHWDEIEKLFLRLKDSAKFKTEEKIDWEQYEKLKKAKGNSLGLPIPTKKIRVRKISEAYTGQITALFCNNCNKSVHVSSIDANYREEESDFSFSLSGRCPFCSKRLHIVSWGKKSYEFHRNYVLKLWRKKYTPEEILSEIQEARKNKSIISSLTTTLGNFCEDLARKYYESKGFIVLGSSAVYNEAKKEPVFSKFTEKQKKLWKWIHEVPQRYTSRPWIHGPDFKISDGSHVFLVECKSGKAKPHKTQIKTFDVLSSEFDIYLFKIKDIPKLVALDSIYDPRLYSRLETLICTTDVSKLIQNGDIQIKKYLPTKTGEEAKRLLINFYKKST